ncbi:hypothetical protein GJAV_G00002510 [Gymnothorax javanicus]|nr:hypothetical protein GJAV_G00002510 [Gymnothorax javanicus]
MPRQQRLSAFPSLSLFADWPFILRVLYDWSIYEYCELHFPARGEFEPSEPEEVDPSASLRAPCAEVN